VSMGWLSPTRATGIAAYGFALACCGLVWATAKGDRVVSRLAALLTFMEGALFLDIVFNWRWILHQALMDEAMRRHLYGTRRGPQEIVLGVLVVLFAFSIFLSLRLLINRAGALLAAIGGLLSIVLWCTEVISLHYVDSITEHQFGKLMAISLMWLLASLITSIGILAEARASKRRIFNT